MRTSGRGHGPQQVQDRRRAADQGGVAELTSASGENRAIPSPASLLSKPRGRRRSRRTMRTCARPSLDIGSSMARSDLTRPVWPPDLLNHAVSVHPGRRERRTRDPKPRQRSGLSGLCGRPSDFAIRAARFFSCFSSRRSLSSRSRACFMNVVLLFFAIRTSLSDPVDGPTVAVAGAEHPSAGAYVEKKWPAPAGRGRAREVWIWVIRGGGWGCVRFELLGGCWDRVRVVGGSSGRSGSSRRGCRSACPCGRWDRR